MKYPNQITMFFTDLKQYLLCSSRKFGHDMFNMIIYVFPVIERIGSYNRKLLRSPVKPTDLTLYVHVTKYYQFDHPR